jgi:hypothetical protein
LETANIESESEAKVPLTGPIMKMGIVIVSRLSKDACLFDLPGADAQDLKEVWGARQQQVRNVWSNTGCWHLNQSVLTLVELSVGTCRSISRKMLQKEFLAALSETPDNCQSTRLFQTLLDLAI